MLEKPDLPDDAIARCLLETYGVRAAGIEFLPLGYDVNASVYRVRSDAGEDYFLKARDDAIYAPGIHIARYLKALGIEQVVAPLPTMTGGLWANAGRYALLLYPWVEGRSGMDAGLSDAQWIEYGEVLRRIHAVRLPDALARTLRTETYVPHEQWTRFLKHTHAGVRERPCEDPLQQQLAAFWCDHHGEVGAMIERVEALAPRMRARTLEFVLCHADIHTNNLMVTAATGLLVVDWDQPMLAPTARDLMFIMGGGIGFGPDARQEALFFEGYGPAAVDLPALAYYRYEWLVQDLGACAEMVFLRGDAGEETRQDAARLFMLQFEPGNLAEIARRLDDVVG